ncbi:MAG: hypothetical protein A2231_11490 [Candidatus Firestonebacteria bacterium RIFOXYA2_FULL_40_8]|nr:MAG: hypothetical protein A2231_11490 [Candidatus Firestonebacteria bacterium RIFOXYA2_FULL_40_8]
MRYPEVDEALYKIVGKKTMNSGDIIDAFQHKYPNLWRKLKQQYRGTKGEGGAVGGYSVSMYLGPRLKYLTKHGRLTKHGKLEFKGTEKVLKGNWTKRLAVYKMRKTK